ncbi:MAG: dut, Deoxyuridine 5-triphosphate nucleotidohydrolase [Candidatus Saccharibacteria bacterium]|nr:dut, Deoxyuridine 5-triphosphate nucleotidohydrolase [Candidatus Saccharibacteria bacterium]
MEVKVKKLRENATLPEYQTNQAAAMDIHACLDEPMTVEPMERCMIPTGLAFEIPEGYEMQIRARSGLSIKHGITMVNGVGTIDADYRGELSVLMINLSKETFTIEPDMRVAQLLISKFEKVSWQLAEDLSETTRGAAGFGSTGFDKKA